MCECKNPKCTYPPIEEGGYCMFCQEDFAGEEDYEDDEVSTSIVCTYQEDSNEVEEVGLPADIDTSHGTFKFTTFETFNDEGVKMRLSFTPNDTGKASRIQYVQIVKTWLGNENTPAPTSPIHRDRMTQDGYYIDRHLSEDVPFYPKLVGTEDLEDTPKKPDCGNSSGQRFETSVLVTAGTEKDKYYGSISWGWEKDSDGIFSLLHPARVTNTGVSALFRRAIAKWNGTNITGTTRTNKSPTNVYDILDLSDGFTIPVNTTVPLKTSSTQLENNLIYVPVEFSVEFIEKLLKGLDDERFSEVGDFNYCFIKEVDLTYEPGDGQAPNQLPPDQ